MNRLQSRGCAALLCASALFAAPDLFAQEADICPNIDMAVKKYIEENHPAEEGKPSGVEYRTLRLNPKVSAAQLIVPANGEDKNAPPQSYLLFFAVPGPCGLVFQTDGEYTEILESGATKYIFVKTEDTTAEESHANFQVVTVRATGEVVNTHDQNGGEIYFSETVQNRCEGKVGEITHFIRDKTDRNRVTLRQQHTDRDGKCRLIEDSSTYKYYRLTPERWELDEGEPNVPVAAEKR